MKNKILYVLENYHFEIVFVFAILFAIIGVYSIKDTHDYNSMKGKYKHKK